MKRHRFLVVGILVSFVVLLAAGGAGWWYYRTRILPFRLVVGGGRQSAGNVSCMTGMLYLEYDMPGVLYATVTKPGAQEEAVFVLVFHHSLTGQEFIESGVPFSLGGHSESGKWEIKDVLTIRGKRMEAVYQMELNESQTAVKREALTVGGESRDLAAGRVFLVKLDGPAPVYVKKNLNLPALNANTEQFVEAVAKALKEQDPESKALLR
jgi:hypothetical protein